MKIEIDIPSLSPEEGYAHVASWLKDVKPYAPEPVELVMSVQALYILVQTIRRGILTLAPMDQRVQCDLLDRAISQLEAQWASDKPSLVGAFKRINVATYIPPEQLSEHLLAALDDPQIPEQTRSRMRKEAEEMQSRIEWASDE